MQQFMPMITVCQIAAEMSFSALSVNSRRPECGLFDYLSGPHFTKQLHSKQRDIVLELLDLADILQVPRQQF